MEKKKKQQELYAIWPYNSPPYWLGGKVVEVKEGGWVSVEKHDGYQFKYYKLYPLAEGESIMRVINAAGIQYSIEKKRAEDKMIGELEKVLGIEPGKMWEVR